MVSDRNKDNRTRAQLLAEIERLQFRLQEAEETLEAIRSADVDALVVTGPQGEQVFSIGGAEHIYRVIVETMNEAALTVDPDGTILFSNQRFCDLMKTSIEGAMGHKVTMFTARPQQTPLKAFLAQAQGGPVQRHLTLRATDGTAVPVQLAASPLQVGGSTSLCLVATDLTELEASANSIRILREHEQALQEANERLQIQAVELETQSEELCVQTEELTAVNAALRRSEERLRLAQQAGRVGVFDRDLQNDTTLWTPELEELFGISPGSFEGKTEDWAKRVYPEDLPHMRAFLQEWIQSDRTEATWEYRFVHANGQVRWMEGHGRIFRDSNGKPLRMIGTNMDITERKQAEVALRESEEQYRRLFADDLTGDFLATPEGKVLECNPSFAEIYGFADRQHALGCDISRFNPGDWASLMARLRDECRVQSHQGVHRRPDGREIHVVANVVGQFNEAAELVEVQGYLYDDTERKHAEDQLQEAHRRLNLHIDNAPLAVVEWDSDFHITRWAGEAAKVFGWTSEEVLGKRLDELPWVYEEDRPGVEQVMVDMLSGRRPRKVNKNRNVRKDGTIIYCEWYNSAISDASGRLVSVLSQVLDVTERYQAEEALRKSEEKFAKAFRSSPIAVAVTRRNDGHIVEVNEAMLRLLRFRRDEVIGRTTLDLGIWVDANDRAQFIQKLSTAGAARDLEYRLRTKDGAIVTIRLSAEVLDFSGEPCLLSTLVNVTEQKEAERALRESEERLKRTQGIAHLGSWELDLVNDHLSWSDEVYRIFGLAPQEFKATYEAFLETVHPDDRAAVDAAYSGSLREGRDTYEIEHRIVRKPAGEIRIVHEKCEHIRDASGRIVRSVGMVLDVTERKQAEDALRKSEYLRRLAQEITGVGTFEWNIVTGVNTWTPELEELYGLPPGGFAGTQPDWEQLVHPEDRAHAVATVTRAFDTSETVEDEWRVIWPDGSIHWLAGRFRILRDQAGKPLALTGVNIDITERKRAEDALRRSEEQFHRLFEEDLTGDFVSTPEGQILLCNPAFARIFGFPSALEAVGTSILDLYLDAQEREPLLARLKQEGKIEPLEVWRKRRDGEPIYVVENLIGHFDEHGELDEIKGYLFDDTDRKRAAVALQESEEKYRTLFDSIDEGFCIVEMVFADDGRPVDYRFLEINPAFEKQTGLHEAKGQLMRTLAPDHEAHWFETYGKIALTGEPARFTNEAKALHRWYDVYAFRVGGQESKKVAILFSDITERRRTEEALRDLMRTLEDKVAQRTAELQQRARQLQKLTLELSETEDRERRQLAEVLHDDLQQQLAAAKFHLSLLHHRAKYDPAQQSLVAQVDQMLMDAIQKSRNLSHELSPVVLYQSNLASALDWLAGQIKTKHGLEVKVDAFGEVSVQSDALKVFLFKAAQEMLFNVVKHARVNQARIRLRRFGRCICLSVGDRGRGFDPQEVRQTKGFGLLSIRERVELLGGRMKMHSVPGQGSTFHIVVPDNPVVEDEYPEAVGAGLPARPGPQAGTSHEELGGHGRPPLRVLLADDHQIVREGLISLLADERDIRVVGEAANGREAVDQAYRLRPDVVIMDVAMPLINGDDATRQIKAHLPNTRVLALSMYEEAEMVEKMRRAGAENYILKTASPEELLTAIRNRESTSEQKSVAVSLPED